MKSICIVNNTFARKRTRAHKTLVQLLNQQGIEPNSLITYDRVRSKEGSSGNQFAIFLHQNTAVRGICLHGDDRLVTHDDIVPEMSSRRLDGIAVTPDFKFDMAIDMGDHAVYASSAEMFNWMKVAVGLAELSDSIKKEYARDREKRALHREMQELAKEVYEGGVLDHIEGHEYRLTTRNYVAQLVMYADLYGDVCIKLDPTRVVLREKDDQHIIYTQRGRYFVYSRNLQDTRSDNGDAEMAGSKKKPQDKPTQTEVPIQNVMDEVDTLYHSLSPHMVIQGLTGDVRTGKISIMDKGLMDLYKVLKSKYATLEEAAEYLKK